MSKWEQECENGLPCKFQDLAGKRFKVRMHGWAWPFLWGNEKRFDYSEDEYAVGIHGINVWRILWGLVVIKWGDYFAKGFNYYIVLDYNHPDNAWYERRIIDHLLARECGDGYIGDFRFKIFGTYWHIAWFTLEKIE